jgi:ubiquitin C-terminal hydrolase
MYLFNVSHAQLPFKTELNLVCHLLPLLGAHHILHVSRSRVKVYFTEDSFASGIEPSTDFIQEQRYRKTLKLKFSRLQNKF